MLTKFVKFTLLLVGICVLSAAPVFADSTTIFSNTAPGVLPTSLTFTADVSVVVSGYSASGVPTALFGDKGGGSGAPSETGLGLAAGLDHEISGSFFIQVNLANVLAGMPKSASISIDSIQAPDVYDVWGSNVAGQLGVELLANQTNFSEPIPDLGTYKYISITAPGTSTVLLDDLEVRTPEPGAAGLLLIGLGALLAAGTLGKKLLA